MFYLAVLEDIPEDLESPESKDSNAVGSDTSIITMGGRKYPPGHEKYVSPKQEAAKAKAEAEKEAEEAKEECDDAVKWYVKQLGFPEPAAQTLYVEQTLTDKEILSKLTDKTN